MQKQSRIYRGHFALIRWLRDNISSATSADDESKLRLESDEQLIRIVTIHKSKGLEYPFVFIPFLFSGRGAEDAWYYDEQGRLSYDLLKGEANLELADSLRLGEDIRLLYVALTRAKYKCYVGTVAYKGASKKSLALSKTAWAYLLFQAELPKPLDDGALMEALDRLQGAFDGAISVQQVNMADILAAKENLSKGHTDSAIDNNTQNQQVIQARQLQGSIEDDWRVHSFTGLMNESHRLQSVRAQTQVTLNQTLSPALSESITIFGFPKGSHAGTFLHTLFESVVFNTAEPISSLKSQYANLEALIDSKLNLSQLVDEDLVPQWAAYLQIWLQSVLNYPLNQSIKLADLAEESYVSEMSFYFSVKQLHAARFNTLLKRFGLGAPDIDFEKFEGHMKGAIDLVFKANDQYFILDYKSNYLGASIEDYSPSALEQVMEEHRYDIQYILYSLATHRFLKHRLGAAYCYERDFGGVYYLFLRGLSLETQVLDIQALEPQDLGSVPLDEQPLRAEYLNAENDLVTHKNPETGVIFVKPPFELINALDLEVLGQ